MLDVLRGVQQFPSDDAWEVSDFEPRYPQFGLRVVDLPHLRHYSIAAA